MKIVSTSNSVLVSSFNKLLNSYGYNNPTTLEENNKIVINFSDSTTDVKWKSKIESDFLLGNTPHLTEVEKEKFISNGVNKNTCVAKVGDSLYIGDGVLEVRTIQGLDKAITDNTDYVNSLFLKTDKTFYKELELPYFIEELEKNVKESRLKTLNVKELLKQIDDSLYENAVANIENVEIQTEEDLLRISLWNSLNKFNYKEKLEVKLYLLYLVTKSIQRGVAKDNAIDIAINLPNDDLEKMSKFYGEFNDVIEVSNGYVDRFALPFSLSNEQEIELDFKTDDYLTNKKDITKFISLINELTNVILPENIAEGIIKSKIKNTVKFNNETLPLYRQNIKDAQLRVVNELIVKFDLAEEDKNLLLKEFSKNKIYHKFNGIDYKKLVNSGILPLSLVEEYVLTRVVYGISSANKYLVDGKLDVELLVTHSQDMNVIFSQLDEIVKTIDLGYKNKIITKTNKQRVEKTIQKTVQQYTFDALQNREIDKVKEVYRLIYTEVK